MCFQFSRQIEWWFITYCSLHTRLGFIPSSKRQLSIDECYPTIPFCNNVVDRPPSIISSVIRNIISLALPIRYGTSAIMDNCCMALMPCPSVLPTPTWKSGKSIHCCISQSSSIASADYSSMLAAAGRVTYEHGAVGGCVISERVSRGASSSALP